MSCCCVLCVNETEAAIIENCGKYDRVLPPGLHFIMCPCEVLRSSVNLKIQHLEINCDTKTKDNSFVQVVVAVQFRVIEDKVSSAFYKLTDPYAQIRSYVNDVVRSTIPSMDLDAAFLSRETVANNVMDRLSQLMLEYGYAIIAVLIIDINPDQRVKYTMNDVMASARQREANAEKAEAEKIVQVKAAEADAESKYLNGLGIARQRKAIVDGLRDTVAEFSHDVDGTGPKDVMDLLLMTQYFEMVKDLGKTGGTTMFLPHGPTAVKQLRDELRENFMTGVKESRSKVVMSNENAKAV